REQLVGTDTAVSDLSTPPVGKQTSRLLDLWSASLTGWPLFRLREAAESRIVIAETCPWSNFSQVRQTLCQFGISKTFCDSAADSRSESGCPDTL
ncbi:hypothetical protein GOODEAATRI_023496, partial [Goodea atripinnis]